MSQTKLPDVADWPAVIKYEGDDELTHIGSDAEWKRDAESYLYRHDGDNVLIDSGGRVFRLERTHAGTVNADDTGTSIQLDDFIRLVRIHASSSHRCCIEKISFRSIAEGIDLVASMNSDDG